MLNNTSGASAGTLAPQPNTAGSNFPAPNFAAPAAVAPQLPVPVGARPVHGVPGTQRAITLPSRPIAIWTVSICVMLLLLTYPLQPLVGLEFMFAYVLAGIEGALRMLLDILVVAGSSRFFLSNDYNSQAFRFMFFGPFMTLEGMYVKLAFDFISRIVIIVLLCQPQVGRYIQMRGGLRRMGVK